MSGKTSIEWTEQSWNPIVGCSIVSPGCTNCYAMKMAARIEAMGNQPRYAGTTRKVNGNAVWTGKLAQAPESVLLAPLKRKKPTTYFVNSMGDLFHEDCPDEWIDRVFAVMALSPQHTFQVLTKRADRMRKYLTTPKVALCWVNEARIIKKSDRLDSVVPAEEAAGWQCHGLPNVWLGVSAERQQEWDERKEHLRATPAAVHFASFEPLLGNITDPRPMSDFLQWAIVGGESGPDSRPMHTDWARGLRDQCAAADVPFFFKQNGAWVEFYDRDRDDPDWRKVPDVDNQMGRGAARWQNLAGGIGFHGERLLAMRNVGKKVAGRLLDGIEHNGFPEVRA